MEFFKKLIKEEDTVDLTPMIDVTFLLLIYFMVTTMLKQPEAELSIQLPGKPANSNLKPMPLLSVEIGDYGQVILNGSEIEQATTSTGAPNYEMLDLVANLKQQKSMRDQLISSGARSKAEAELKVQIESSGIAEHQSSISVLNACSTAGIEKITFAFE